MADGFVVADAPTGASQLVGETATPYVGSIFPFEGEYF